MRTAAIAALALAFCASAAAHVPGHPPKHSQKALVGFQERAYSHARYVAREGTGRPAKWHRKAEKWIGRELRKTRAALERAELRLGPLSCVACWYRVASCESGQRWDYNGGSGYDGGLQFHPSTWTAYGGTRYAPFAYMASAIQQISVASFMSLVHWPVCGSRY